MNVTKMILLGGLVAVTAFWAAPLFSHCQVPCGIYDDQMRFEMMAENIATVEKATREIGRLSAQAEKNYNQIVRWVQNKETHADRIAETLTQYFLTQRIKPIDPKDKVGYENYVKKLTLVHRMLVAAMKCKQTVDPANVEKLRFLLAEFRGVYFGPQEHAHPQGGHEG